MKKLGLGEKFPFEGLITFELANNHQGSVPHAKRIIQEAGALAKKHGVRAAFKFQFRDYDTFIHPAYRDNQDYKFISRLLNTRLSEAQFAELADEVRAQGMITMATPFDEPSVDMLERLNIDILKIASCSATDWPLFERIAQTDRPVICSTAGLEIPQVDRIVSFFQHRGMHFAIMHCVALYPTPTEKLDLNRIALFKNRYPGVHVGYSTHEGPDATHWVGMAYALGARMFEKHIGMTGENITLNSYSATPEQADAWLAAYRTAVDAVGPTPLPPRDPEEHRQLREYMRGAFLRKIAPKGTPIHREDIFFAFPLQEGQMLAGEWKPGMVADRDYQAGDPLSQNAIITTDQKKQIIYSTIHSVKGMLNEAKIPVGVEFFVELSHHYGIENFPEVGVTIIDCINREYCKKILVQLPNQRHPSHYHQKKEETFQMLWGQLEVELEGRRKTLYAGDTLLVPRGVWHRFWTETGAIFEEVSTTHFNDDSFYEDRSVARMPREERKTKLMNWGRHQFD